MGTDNVPSWNLPVLIDGDIVAYRAATSCEGRGVKDAIDKVDDYISNIVGQCLHLKSSHLYEIFLTGKTNFRFDIAKTADYKGNRKDSPKPRHLKAVREYMIAEYGASVSSGEEADDAIARAATEYDYECIVASIDKDFKQVPCWHYNFVKHQLFKVEEFEGLEYFYQQVLTGDAADNIKGLVGIGPVKATKLLKGCKTEHELYLKCVKAYGGDEERVLENGRLLWLRRTPEELWEPPVKTKEEVTR